MAFADVAQNSGCVGEEVPAFVVGKTAGVE
jgi:hypothetical protein